MNSVKHILLILTLSILFGACDNTIDLTADYKETAVVYALLDPDADRQYVRIGKVFLNEEGNALDHAKENDSLFFDSAIVKITEFYNGNFSREIILQRIDGDQVGAPKADGVFANSPNWLFYTDEEIRQSEALVGEFKYILEITNPATGFKATGTTLSSSRIIRLSSPFVENDTENYPDQPNNYKLALQDTNNSRFTLRYQQGFNVKAYDIVLRFRYKEKLMSDTTVQRIDSVDWKVQRFTLTNPSVLYDNQQYSIFGIEFYRLLKAKIPPTTTYIREPYNAELIFYGANKDLYDYINVNKPSIGIVQKKPEYTNVDNAVGIFGVRMTNRFKNIQILAPMRDRLANSYLMDGLNFQE